MDKKKRIHNYDKYKASICLLCIFSACFLMQRWNQTNAKVIKDIFITEGSAAPQAINVGQQVEFSAKYQAGMEGDEYFLHVCKSKKMSLDQYCQDGSWCDSSAFSVNNPLSCLYTTTPQKNANNNYYMFICDKNKQCSSPFSGKFSIIRNTLTLQAPGSLDLKPVPFSFEPQESADNAIEELVITSQTSNNAGWSLDVTSADWIDGDGISIDYDGDGSTTGQLTTDLDQATIESTEAISGIILGKTDSFSTTVKTINIATASKKNGNGTFTIKGVRFDQSVPGNQKEGEYKTVLTFTIS